MTRSKADLPAAGKDRGCEGGSPTEPNSGWQGGGGGDGGGNGELKRLWAAAPEAASSGSSGRGCLYWEPRRAGAPHAEAEHTHTHTQDRQGAGERGSRAGLGRRRAAAAGTAAVADAAAASTAAAASDAERVFWGSWGDADQTPGRRWTTCCSPQTCCCWPLPYAFIYFSFRGSYLGRDPIPFFPEVSLLKPGWTHSFFLQISHFSSLLNCLGLCRSLPQHLRFPLSVLREPGSARYGGRCHRRSHCQSLLPTEFTAFLAVIRQECLQFERRNISHLCNPVPGFFLRVAERWVGAWGSLIYSLVDQALFVLSACARVLPSSSGRLRGSLLPCRGSWLTLAQVMGWGWKSKERCKGSKSVHCVSAPWEGVST